MSPDPAITILLPAYNEAAAIRSVIEGVGAACAALPTACEILVVNDGSTDDTERIARDLGARVVAHRARRGAGAAIKTGILAARGSVILLMDADASYPAGEIPRFLLEIETCRQVVGARRVEAGSMPFLRSAVKTALRKLGEFLVKTPIPDINSGMRAFRRRDALAFFHLLPDGHSCVTTLTLCFLGLGLPVHFLSIDYLARKGASKFHVVKDTLRFFVQIVRTVAYFAPLRVFLTASFVFFALGAGKSAWDVHRRGGLEESDIILFTFAATTVVLGILADLIVKLASRGLVRDLFPATGDEKSGK